MADAKTCWLGAALSLPPLFFLICCVDAASFQHYQLLQKDPDYRFKNLQRFPNPDMIKALEYLESLRQQANKGESIPDYNSYQGIQVPFQQKEIKDQSHLADSLKDSLSEDESQWMQIILEALRQAEKESKAAVKENKAYPLSSDKSFPVEVSDDYESQPWPERRHRHNKLPRLYEDSTNAKRTNEIVEEQYTPQSLATLESVFQELGKLTEPNSRKRERLDEEQKLYADDEDDIYRVNNIAYEDVVGGEDWNPIEEKVESQTQEEVRDSKEEIEKNEEEVDDEMKRSGKLGLLDEEIRKENKEQLSDEVSRLMNYYLKKIMNGVGNGRQRSGPNEEKRATKVLEKRLDPQAIYDLIEISRNLQIPPEDLIDMLKVGERPRERVETEQDSELPDDPDETPEADFDHPEVFQSKVNSKNGYPKPPANAGPDALPENLNIEDILNILGTDNVANQKPTFFGKQLSRENVLPRLTYVPGRPRGHQAPKVPWLTDQERRPMEYENVNGKDEELGDYLAKMLAKYPEVMNSNQMKRVPVSVSSEDEQQEEDQIEQAIKDHLNQLGSQESEKLSLANKRLSLAQENDDTQNGLYLDEDMLMKVLEYLNQEKTEKGRGHMNKRAMENM
ncbi:secretogranin-2 [Tachyglossus aculeatus]|uniref:secretogranin-2 n=1 Tax=Tachyglossus aculeatus TaxID=9261 RepID=UPI0018F384F0|nr:secretogranin-2 [Tachyglossus aculeatus]